ncbi:WD40 repeat-like protein [Ceratobasidium sp. AG-I]|nr:WD40 repeat-like protein [Ceratobasidium sp. AG-I]
MDFLRGYKDIDDISLSLRDRDSWKPAVLKQLALKGELAVIAHDVVGGILAAATDTGHIYVFGSPAATHCLYLQGTAADTGVKHLGFAASGTRLVACDTRNKLHVWTFTSAGPPKLEGSWHVGDVVNCMATSLYHSHAFLGLKSGRTFTFDIDRIQFSPYSIPNAWQTHESILRRSGVLASPTSPSFDVSAPPMVIDLAIHPRDLNLLLIAYERGVVVWNITDGKPSSHYVLTLLPGAPGAILEPDKAPILMDERSPPPTCVVWHPDGRLFAVGHMDGCISFWSLEEEDKPLDVRTVDRAGVHKVDFEAFAAAAALSPYDSPPARTHEPVYKLAWTSKILPPGSTAAKGSYLTILGGLDPSAPPGIPVLYFPSFVAPTNTTVTSEGLDSNPALRDALITSVTPTAYAEILSNPHLTVEDITPIPEHNQLLLTKSARDGKRTICVEQHPPSTFVDTVGSLTDIPLYDVGAGTSVPPVSQNVLDARPIGACLGVGRLPVELVMADVVDVQLCVVPKTSVGALVRQTVDQVFGRTATEGNMKEEERMSWLRAGQALPNTEGQSKMAKFEVSRIIVATHRDGLVRFYDTSSQLLLKPSPLCFEHPQPLPNLTIDPHRTISHPLLASRRGPDLARPTQIRAVHAAPTLLDCSVVLSSGWVVVYAFAEKGAPVPFEARPAVEGLWDLRPASFEDEEGFRPVCLLAEDVRGEVTCAALSDVGFLAVAYEDCSIAVIDVRDVNVMFRYEPHIEDGRKSAADGPIRSFRWTQCALSEVDPFAIHLVGITESGLARFFTLSPPGTHASDWSVQAHPKPIRHSALSHPIFSAVLDVASGRLCEPSAEGIQRITEEAGRPGGIIEQSLWIAASRTRIRIYASLGGREIAGVDVGGKSGREIGWVDLVERHGETVLVTLDCDGEVIIYSVPRLDKITHFSIGFSIRQAHFDSQGDYITLSQHGTLTLSTLVDFSRAQPPLVDFSTPAAVLRDRPEPAEVVGIVSWLWTARTKSGAEIDALLAGPDRPLPKVKKPIERPSAGTSSSASGSNLTRAASSNTTRPASSSAARSGGRDDVYSRLTAAVSERGEMLSGLEDKFGHLEAASKDLASQAKRLATQQTAKRWFGL